MTAQHTVNGNVFLSPVFLCSVLLGMVAVVANKGKIPVFMLTRVEMQRQIDDAIHKAVEPLAVTTEKQTTADLRTEAESDYPPTPASPQL